MQWLMQSPALLKLHEHLPTKILQSFLLKNYMQRRVRSATSATLAGWPGDRKYQYMLSFFFFVVTEFQEEISTAASHSLDTYIAFVFIRNTVKYVSTCLRWRF